MEDVENGAAFLLRDTAECVLVHGLVDLAAGLGGALGGVKVCAGAPGILDARLGEAASEEISEGLRHGVRGGRGVGGCS